ncbi:hypothetical protein [Halolamina sp.]|uniref:hypothetical protein n=1 Tax=Halolamina sp. TaxID=1940283 RepID=UPI003562335E
MVLAVLPHLISVFLTLWDMLDVKARTDHPLAWGLTILFGLTRLEYSSRPDATWA